MDTNRAVILHSVHALTHPDGAVWAASEMADHQLLPKGNLFGVSCSNLHCSAVGYYIADSGSTSAAIYESDDSDGLYWVRGTIPSVKNTDFSAVACTDEKEPTCVASNPNRDTGGGVLMAYKNKTTGGAWNFTTNFPAITSTLNAMACAAVNATSTNCMAVVGNDTSGNFLLLLSTDMGKTWVAENQLADVPGSLHSIACKGSFCMMGGQSTNGPVIYYNTTAGADANWIPTTAGNFLQNGGSIDGLAF